MYIRYRYNFAYYIYRYTGTSIVKTSYNAKHFITAKMLNTTEHTMNFSWKILEITHFQKKNRSAILSSRKYLFQAHTDCSSTLIYALDTC